MGDEGEGDFSFLDGTPEAWLRRSSELHRGLFEQTENPVHVWSMIGDAWRIACSAALSRGEAPPDPFAVTPMPLPDWCLRELARSAWRIEGLTWGHDPRANPAGLDAPVPEGEEPTLSAGRAVDLLPEALGFRRPGWNAFSEIASHTESLALALWYRDLTDRGMSRRQAFDVILTELDRQDERSLRRRLAQAEGRPSRPHRRRHGAPDEP